MTDYAAPPSTGAGVHARAPPLGATGREPSAAAVVADDHHTGRPEMYETQCPFCFEAVHFSLMRDSNNLMCPSCAMLFDATHAYAKAEIVAALSIQKHARGRFARMMMRHKQEPAHAAEPAKGSCPACSESVHFTHDRETDSLVCPSCATIFHAERRDKLMADCPACSAGVHYSLDRRSHSLVCSSCATAFQPPAQPGEPKPPPREEPTPMRAGTVFERGKLYHAPCPVCSLSVSFRLHQRLDTIACPNCSIVFHGAIALKAVAMDVLAVLTIQKHARGRLTRRAVARQKTGGSLKISAELGQAVQPGETSAHTPPQHAHGKGAAVEKKDAHPPTARKRLSRPPRGSLYQMSCPTCEADVHFSPYYDTHNLLCPTCMTIFDARKEHRWAEVISAIRIQKEVRRRQAMRLRDEMRRQLSARRAAGARPEMYVTDCPSCFKGVHFALLRDTNNLLCGHCSTMFDATTAYRQADVIAAIRIQQRLRSKMAMRLKARLLGRRLADAPPPDAEAPPPINVAAATAAVSGPRAASPLSPTSPGARPEMYVTDCPSCFKGVHFELLRDTNNLLCGHCSTLFDATSAYKQAEVLAAIHVQKHARGRLERRKSTLVRGFLHRGKLYHAPCPVCSTSVSFRLHQRGDAIVCPNCAMVYHAGRALKTVAIDALAVVTIQKYTRGRLERKRTLQRRASKPSALLPAAPPAAAPPLPGPAAPEPAHASSPPSPSPPVSRPDMYVTDCPTCFKGVHFSLLRDTNNLLCPECSTMFDATSAYKQAEVLAAIHVQKHARGRLERRKHKLAKEFLQRGKRYHVPCPVCGSALSFKTHRESHDVVLCPHCCSVFSGSHALKSVSVVVLAAMHIQRHARGRLERARHGDRRRASIRARAASLAGPRPASPLSPTSAGSRPEMYVTDCPSCFKGVHFELLRDTNNLLCGHCSTLFDATSAYKQAEVLAAIHVQKHARGRLERRKSTLVRGFLHRGKLYHAPCPVCSTSVSFRLHQRGDAIVCPNCAMVFHAGRALKTVAMDALAVVTIQKHTRGRLERKRAEARRARKASQVLQPMAEVPEEREAEPLPPPPPPPLPELIDTRCPHCSWAGTFERPKGVSQLWCKNCNSPFMEREVQLQHDAALLIQRHARGKLTRDRGLLSPVAKLIKRLTTPEVGGLNRTRCPACETVVTFRPESGDVTVCPSCSHMFSGHEAMRKAAEKAVLDIQRIIRGRIIRTMLKRLKRSMRPSQLVRASSKLNGAPPKPAPPAAPAPAAEPPPGPRRQQRPASAAPRPGLAPQQRPVYERVPPPQPPGAGLAHRGPSLHSGILSPAPAPAARPAPSSPEGHSPVPGPPAGGSAHSQVEDDYGVTRVNMARPSSARAAGRAQPARAAGPSVRPGRIVPAREPQRPPPQYDEGGEDLANSFPPRRRTRAASGGRRRRASPNGATFPNGHTAVLGRTTVSVEELRGTGGTRVTPRPGPRTNRPPSPRGNERLELIAQIYGIAYSRGKQNKIQLERTPLPKQYPVRLPPPGPPTTLGQSLPPHYTANNGGGVGSSSSPPGSGSPTDAPTRRYAWN